MRQSDDPPTYEEKWAILAQAIKRVTTDGEAKRLLVNREVAVALADYINEATLPQLQTLSSLRRLLFQLSRHSLGGKGVRNPMERELRVILKPNVSLDGKAVQLTEVIREMCKLLRLRLIPASDCACEDGRLKFQIKGLTDRQWGAISFGIEEEPDSVQATGDRP